MLHVLGWVMVALLVVYFETNSAFMLISPQRWFQLPNWIRAQGTLSRKKFGTGWGAIQVRITGGVMLAIILWVVYDAIIRFR